MKFYKKRVKSLKLPAFHPCLLYTSVRRMERTDLFQTDLRQVFDLIRFSGNRERLRDLIEQEPAYGKLEEDAFDFASSYVGLRELSKWKEAVRAVSYTHLFL